MTDREFKIKLAKLKATAPYADAWTAILWQKIVRKHPIIGYKYKEDQERDPSKKGRKKVTEEDTDKQYQGLEGVAVDLLRLSYLDLRKITSKIKNNKPIRKDRLAIFFDAFRWFTEDVGALTFTDCCNLLGLKKEEMFLLLFWVPYVQVVYYLDKYNAQKIEIPYYIYPQMFESTKSWDVWELLGNKGTAVLKTLE